MPEQPISLHELELLARFGTLRVLTVNIQAVNVPATPQFPPRPISKETLQLRSYFMLHELRPNMVYDLARFLLTCWDDIVLVMAGRELDPEEPIDKLDHWVYDTLLREISRIKKREPSPNTACWA
ncbi:hypothetical protein FS749_008404 [Ceratobasidium sp. UAMH 11750]|nr:hypothetical protein FS749_008404 [Ceratobasidium sp. UAMH 11750]